MPEWNYDPNDYVTKKEVSTVEGSSPSCFVTQPVYWDATPQEKIDMVIESLVSGIDNKYAYMTREEIGIYLRYANPTVSIGTIHNTHPYELDHLSETRKVADTKGRPQVFYSPRGVVEVMSHSRQPMVGVFLRRFAEAVKQKNGGSTFKVEPKVDAEPIDL